MNRSTDWISYESTSPWWLLPSTVAFGILIWLVSYPAALAETVFAQPIKQEQLGAGENYQESRFGSPPAAVDLGVTPHYASRAVEEMENGDPDEATPSKGRSLAALNSNGVTAEPISASSTERKGIQEVGVIASDLGFFPKTLFVAPEVPVRLFITGASKNTLCIMMDSFQVRKQVRSQRIEEINFTPSTPGKYRFYCPVNGMEGTLIVKDLVALTAPGAPGETSK